MNACWNHIGVHGDRSCPELASVVHCRNCPIHAEAATSLLEREPPDAYVSDWTTHLSRSVDAGDADTRSILIFRVGAEWLALPTTSILEVIETRPVHSLPGRRKSVLLGVVNVRGELLVCVSLGGLLGLAPSPPAPRPGTQLMHARMLVLNHGHARAVCPVDEVHGVHHFPARALHDVPATVARASSTHSKAVLSWDGHSVGILDDELTFASMERSLR